MVSRINLPEKSSGAEKNLPVFLLRKKVSQQGTKCPRWWKKTPSFMVNRKHPKIATGKPHSVQNPWLWVKARGPRLAIFTAFCAGWGYGNGRSGMDIPGLKNVIQLIQPMNLCYHSNRAGFQPSHGRGFQRHNPSICTATQMHIT